MTSLNVFELFLSIQGESTHAGRRCGFIRLAGCNLDCAWCDTVKAAKSVGDPTLLDDIVKSVKKWNVSLVEVTGGEPLIADNCDILIARLLDEDFEVLVETNGTVDINKFDRRAKYIVDYKLLSSGHRIAFCDSNFGALKKGDELKFVIADRKDFDEAASVVAENEIDNDVEILISPLWGKIDLATLTQWLIDSTLNARINLQLHKIIWGGDCEGV